MFPSNVRCQTSSVRQGLLHSGAQAGPLEHSPRRRRGGYCVNQISNEARRWKALAIFYIHDLSIECIVALFFGRRMRETTQAKKKRKKNTRKMFACGAPLVRFSIASRKTKKMVSRCCFLLARNVGLVFIAYKYKKSERTLAMARNGTKRHETARNGTVRFSCM